MNTQKKQAEEETHQGRPILRSEITMKRQKVEEPRHIELNYSIPKMQCVAVQNIQANKPKTRLSSSKVIHMKARYALDKLYLS